MWETEGGWKAPTPNAWSLKAVDRRMPTIPQSQQLGCRLRACSWGFPHHGCSRPRSCPSQAGRVSAARHPDLTDDSQRNSGDAPRPDVESDRRYVRNDDSLLLAHQARVGFAEAVAGGEPSMRLAEAALWASAEDDATASHSTVPFPVHSYLGRITSVTGHVKQQLGMARLLPQQQVHGQPVDPEAVLNVVERALFIEPINRKGHGNNVARYNLAPVTSWGFTVPEHGRSALPNRVVVHHAGTWEVARDAYLHEVLIRKAGHAAALAIIYAQVMSELLVDGAVDFAVTMDVGTYDDPPTAAVLPGITRAVLLSRNPYPQPHPSVSSQSPQPVPHAGAQRGKGVAQLINTCSSDALAELHRHLKRTYWCWSWDNQIDAYEEGGGNSLGGFRAAAKAALGDDMDAALGAITRVAAWRLDRGIWTSPGAGDIRRCRAATERLVLLRGGEDQQPEERRDLAVLLLHCGELSSAQAELSAYMSTPAYMQRADPFDKVLCQRLMQLLRSTLDAVPEARSYNVELLTVDSVLNSPTPQDMRVRPLTW